MENIALVVGATGISGGALAEKLVENGWTTYGLSRSTN
ncbi:MAG: NAD-dependent dehydratase, partial [Pedobacter sp.]